MACLFKILPHRFAFGARARVSRRGLLVRSNFWDSRTLSLSLFFDFSCFLA